MKYLFVIWLICSSLIFSQYITPNTGVDWTMDSLVVYSSGAVTGSFPDYNINQKIVVSESDRLRVEAGSHLFFQSSTTGIEVNGILHAIGTEQDSILFTSTQQDSTGSYEGIRFNNNNLTAVSTISFAKIEYAETAFRCVDISPVLQNSYLFKCGVGVRLSSSDAQILTSRIERCYEYGITMTLGSSPFIDSNLVINNNTEDTSPKNQISVGLQGNNSPIITNNIIEGGWTTKAGGISIWVNGASAFSNAVIKGNEINDNSFGITLYSTSDGAVNVVVDSNLIFNNNKNPDPLVSGSGININGTPFNKPIIKRNEVFGNWWGVTIQNGTTVQPGPEPNLGNIENQDSTDDGENFIYDNIQMADTFDLYNNCTNDVYAQNNNWGVYDSLGIENHIFHKKDNSQHGLVKFIPFIKPTSLQDINNEFDFVLEQNYPNPFNPSTKIKFTIPTVSASETKQSLVTLKVYDVLGNEVSTLVDEYKPAGSYEVEFNISSGIRNLASGIYFYQLKIGNTLIQSKKMLLLK